jgi:Protein of unknown function (DUF1501)
MLNIPGPRSRYCDGISRRSFLKAGTFAFGATAFNMVDILRAEARAGTSAPHKAVINIYLGGGPAHQDMWEIKTQAPREIRGEFNPISTSVPGIQISEVFPRVASLMHKCVVIRSVVGCQDRHDPVQCFTGYPSSSLQPLGGRPSIGSTVTRLQGNVDNSVPPFVGLAAPTQHRPWSDPGQTGFLGPAYASFKPDGPGLENMTLSGVTTDRFNDRRRMLDSFDNLRRDVDFNATMLALDSATHRALGVLTSNKLVRALDITQEPVSVRERYGDGKPYQFQFDGAPTVNDQLLMARRLVEAGVRCVTLTFGRWGSHGQNFAFMRDHGGKLDQCLSALIEDLDVRGMLNDTTVAVWGEFGRTPRINGNAGRDHWAPVSCCLLAGGGMRTGQAIGSTNRLGEVAATRPVTHGEILATIYHNLGIAPNTTILDPTGRPQFLTEQSAMPELV